MDTVLAYQVGNKLQVEVDIVLPKEMLLVEAHDVGELLQHEVRGVITFDLRFSSMG